MQEAMAAVIRSNEQGGWVKVSGLQAMSLQGMPAGAAAVLNRVSGLQSKVSLKPMYEGTPHYIDAIRNMNEMGFEVTGLFPIARDNALRVIELDCIMVQSAVVGEMRSVHPA